MFVFTGGYPYRLMPARTISRCISGCRWMAAELQQWRITSSGSPSVSSRKRRNCCSVYRSPSSPPSASAKCVYAPLSFTCGHSCSVFITCSFSFSVRMPIRPIPVSIFKWTSVCFPVSVAADSHILTISGEHTVWIRPASTPCFTSYPVTAPSTRIGIRIPASRRAVPSSTEATASMEAPPCIAALAVCRAPCPYPSALTTASARTCSGRALQISRIFCSIFPGSTTLLFLGFTLVSPFPVFP